MREINQELSDLLFFEFNRLQRIFNLVCMFLLSSKSLVIFSFPLNFFIPHVLNEHISCQSHLLDFWSHIFKDLVLISGVEQRNSNLAQVNCFGRICRVGEVCNVLESNQNLVF